MPTETQIKALEQRVEALHRARFIPPMVLWIQNQPTGTLTALRHIIETGEGNLAEEIERVLNDQNK
jgi:hypothetical protein